MTRSHQRGANDNDHREQLAADRADHESRVADKRRMRASIRHHTAPLHRAFMALTEVAYSDDDGRRRWSRDDLIQLVGLALAEAEAQRAEDADET